MIPARVRVLSSYVDVKFVDRVPDVDGDAYAAYDEKTATINMVKGMSNPVMQDTLLHEIIHAILQAYEMDNEKLVRILTPALLGVVKDNPELVLFLQG